MPSETSETYGFHNAAILSAGLDPCTNSEIV